MTMVCDITQPQDCTAAIAQAVALWGGVDVLVNNPAFPTAACLKTPTRPFCAGDGGELLWHHAHDPCGPAPAAGPARGGGGPLQRGGLRPLLGRTGYCASKHALHGFFDTLRTEVQEARRAGHAHLPVLHCHRHRRGGAGRSGAAATSPAHHDRGASLRRTTLPGAFWLRWRKARRSFCPTAPRAWPGGSVGWLPAFTPALCGAAFAPSLKMNTPGDSAMHTHSTHCGNNGCGWHGLRGTVDHTGGRRPDHRQTRTASPPTVMVSRQPVRGRSDRRHRTTATQPAANGNRPTMSWPALRMPGANRYTSGRTSLEDSPAQAWLPGPEHRAAELGRNAIVMEPERDPPRWPSSQPTPGRPPSTLRMPP